MGSSSSKPRKGSSTSLSPVSGTFHYDSSFKFIDESSPEPESIVHPAKAIPEPQSKETSLPNASKLGDGKSITATAATDDDDENEDRFDSCSDNDSGNASISSDGAHSDDEHNGGRNSSQNNSPTGSAVQLRQKNSFSGLMSINRMSTSFINSTSSSRNAAQSGVQLSHFERIQLGKIVAKCHEGDLIEIHCVCDCLKSFELRASLNSRRSRFRRSLHHPASTSHPFQSHVPTIPHSSQSSLGLVNTFRRSFGKSRQVSLAELPVQRTDSMSNSRSNQPDKCCENYHYVLVHRIQDGYVHCFHVKPCQRTAIVDDDRSLGVIKYETFETIINSTIYELEDRHWQCGGRFLKSPKLSIHYRIRNQEKLSQQVLKKTLNASPSLEQISRILMNIRECYVKYHKIHCNAEHYVTLWRYGIGWSTWADGRQQIIKALDDFVKSFSQLFIMKSAQNTSQNSSQDCDIPKPTLLVNCFGLHGPKLLASMESFMRCQIVIANSQSLSNNHDKKAEKISLEEEEVNKDEDAQICIALKAKTSTNIIDSKIVPETEVQNCTDLSTEISQESIKQ